MSLSFSSLSIRPDLVPDHVPIGNPPKVIPISLLVPSPRLQDNAPHRAEGWEWLPGPKLAKTEWNWRYLEVDECFLLLNSRCTLCR